MDRSHTRCGGPGAWDFPFPFFLFFLSTIFFFFFFLSSLLSSAPNGEMDVSWSKVARRGLILLFSLLPSLFPLPSSFQTNPQPEKTPRRRPRPPPPLPDCFFFPLPPSGGWREGGRGSTEGPVAACPFSLLFFFFPVPASFFSFFPPSSFPFPCGRRGAVGELTREKRAGMRGLPFLLLYSFFPTFSRMVDGRRQGKWTENGRSGVLFPSPFPWGTFFSSPP